VDQQSLASQGVFRSYGRQSRREQFLDEMEKLLTSPYAQLAKVIR